MDVAAWKARSKRTVELPSGASVVIRLPSVPALLRAGRIPNHLLSMAQEYATAGVDPTKFDEKGHD